MSYKVHSIISIESEGRNENLSASGTDFIYQLTQPINFKKRSDKKQYFVRIENIRIPISFYNINSNYGVFGWTGSVTGAVSFTITFGNYTIDELIAEVQTQMNALDTNTYTLTYDEITQKVTITSDGAEDLSGITGNGWRTLGFDGTETITGASSTTGTNIAYTNTTKHIKVLIDNLTSNNVYCNTTTPGTVKQTNLQRVSAIVPITETRNEYQLYVNDSGAYIKLPNLPSITDLRVKLVNGDNYVIDLHNVPWGCDVVIYEYNAFYK